MSINRNHMVTSYDASNVVAFEDATPTIGDDIIRAAALSDSGQWSGLIPMRFVPVAAANQHDGRVLFWSAYDRYS